MVVVVAMTCRCHNSRPHHVFWQTNPNRQVCVTVASFARPSFPNPFVGTCRDGEIKKPKEKRSHWLPLLLMCQRFVCVCVIRVAQLTHSVRLSRWIFLITIKCNAWMVLSFIFYFLFSLYVNVLSFSLFCLSCYSNTSAPPTGQYKQGCCA